MDNTNNTADNTTKLNIFKNICVASLGLFLFGFGTYLTILASIGVGPWDTFALGVSGTLGILYGNASIAISLAVLCVDLLLKEKIGIGMFLDAIIVGKTVDLFDLWNPIPTPTSFWVSLLLMTAGMTVMGFSQYLYMKAGLGCGPRDTLTVGLSRRAPKVPIGVIGIGIMATVTLLGFLLGGPVGIGTVITAVLEGPIMGWAFKIMKFRPTEVAHRSIGDSIKVLFGKVPKE